MNVVLYIYLPLILVQTSSEIESHSVVSDSLSSHELWPTRLLCPWNSPGKNTRVSCHSLLQGIFPTQELNLDLPYCRQILYHLSHQGYFKLCWTDHNCKEREFAIGIDKNITKAKYSYGISMFLYFFNLKFLLLWTKVF